MLEHQVSHARAPIASEAAQTPYRHALLRKKFGFSLKLISNAFAVPTLSPVYTPLLLTFRQEKFFFVCVYLQQNKKGLFWVIKSVFAQEFGHLLSLQSHW
jgi:hypothetical protein